LDLLDFNAVKDWVKINKPDFVIHAAGIVGGIAANINDPIKFYLENLDIGRNVIWASKLNNVKSLLNLGSSCMYPRSAVNPLNEDMILTGQLEPTNEGYALAKIMAFKLCEYISKDSNLFQYKTLIPCNIYGRYDHFDPIKSHLIPAVIQKIHLAKVGNLKSVEIWGDGLARREFMYAGDLADAICQAVDSFQTLPNCMNIGLGEDYSITDYYHTIAKAIGYKGSFNYNLSKPVGMARKIVCIDKQNNWGWKHKMSLEEGIYLTYDYYLNHK
jgi:GDP-L-fucose synthase